MEQKLRINDNIAILRHRYGESQEELAFAIGLGGPSSIANYENGLREPPRAIIEKIAKHYNVTIEELLHSEMNENDYEDMINAILTAEKREDDPLFPFFDKEQPEEEYLEALHSHKSILKKHYNNEDIFVQDVVGILEKYDHSFVTKRNYLAIANYLSLFVWASYQRLLMGFGRVDFDLEKGWNARQAHRFLNITLGDSELKQGVDTKAEQLSNSICTVCFSVFQALHCAGFLFSAFADYYWALLYILNLSQNGDSPVVNRNIGSRMMVDLKNIGNPFAKKIIEMIIPNS